jgi:hypothetical protein
LYWRRCRIWCRKDSQGGLTEWLPLPVENPIVIRPCNAGEISLAGDGEAYPHGRERRGDNTHGPGRRQSACRTLGNCRQSRTSKTAKQLRTHVLLTPEEMGQAAKKSVSYRAPGQ